VRAREQALGYYVDSGRYWECADRLDADDLAEIDALWLDAHPTSNVDNAVA